MSRGARGPCGSSAAPELWERLVGPAGRGGWRRRCRSHETARAAWGELGCARRGQREVKNRHPGRVWGLAGPCAGSRGNYASTRSAQRFPKATAKFLPFVKKDKSLVGTSSVTLLQQCCSSGFTFINSVLLESWPHTTLPFLMFLSIFYGISNAFILLLINREKQMPDCHLAVVLMVHRESTILIPSPSLPVPYR